MGFFGSMLGGEAKAPKTGSHALPQDVQQWINVDATARTKGTDVATAELDRQLAQGYQAYDPRKAVAGESQAEKEARWAMGRLGDEQDPYMRAMGGLLGKTPEENDAENALARSLGGDLTDKAGIAAVHGAMGRDLSDEKGIGQLKKALSGDLTSKDDITRLHGYLGKDLAATDMQGQVKSLTGGDLANEAGLAKLGQFRSSEGDLIDPEMMARMHELAGKDTQLANNTGSIEALYNPQLQGVIDPTMADMEREYLRAQMENDAQAGGSFGGSRQGVMDAVSLGEYLRGRATVGGQLRSDAWDKAAGLAAGDMDRINSQLGAVTQGLGTSANARQGAAGALTNIYSAGAQGRQGAAGVAGQNMERLAGVRQGAADTANRGLATVAGVRQNAADTIGRGVATTSGARTNAVGAAAQGLGAVSGSRQGAAQVQAQGLGALNNARTSTLNAYTNALTGGTGARVQAAQAQAGMGANQRSIEQAERDMAYQNFLGQQGFTWDQLNKYNQGLGSTHAGNVAAGVPSGGGGAQPADQGWLGKAAGIAGTAAGIAGMFGFCDRRAKRDIEWLDDLVPGVGIYNFRYADDPLGPVYTGVMAQEVELVAPHAVTEIPGGMLAVNFNAFIPG